jgi:TolA-binding protein
MNPKVKLAAYATLLILAAWCGFAFRSNYAEATKAATAESSDTAAAGGTNTEAAAAPSTNAETNLTAQTTNVSGDVTNLTAQTTNASGDAATLTTQITNASGELTNGPTPATNAPAKRVHRAGAALPPAKLATADASSARGAMIRDLGCFIAAIIGLGLLIAVDVTHYFGAQASSYLFSDIGGAMRDPLYERAEAEWANGTYLEAIQLLREYLQKNPRELHASVRIAEIYEKDLKNYLAAALEYEEVLKHKIPAEKWGWAAIHLCNLYSKLNQQDKTRALLQRIVNEHPKTAAAKKARAHLGMAELEDEPLTEESVETSEESAAPPGQNAQDEPEARAPKPEPPKSNLPPGFRPKE